MTDTTTAAIIARCDHIEHCAMNHHHQDADRMRALVAERDQALARERALLDSNKHERDLLKEINAIRYERDQLARDAARYRWLRERDLDTIYAGGVFAGQTPENIVLNLEDLDQAVDQAMETGQ